MFFESVESAPPDVILGLSEAFKQDPNPAKINLSVGVYKDARGDTPVLEAVKQAEQRLLATETTKSYLAIEGTKEYGEAVRTLLFGQGHEVIEHRRAVTADTPGGTGALRVAADFLKSVRPNATVWISEPTWPNHPDIFQAAGLHVKTYPYYDASAHALDFPAMTAALAGVAESDIVVLHGCCHNPTGIDPTIDQWTEIARVLRAQGAVPLLDFAYQGLGAGLEADAAGLRTLCHEGCELFVASSFSKNFGLYRERTGALTLVAPDEPSAAACLTRVKRAIRANYSNPPAHGAAIVTTVLGDSALRESWELELTQMRERIAKMRILFVNTLKEMGVRQDFSFLEKQKGMFSFSGLSKAQVETLRERDSIYIVGSGRINVAGMTEANMETLCRAIAAVL